MSGPTHTGFLVSAIKVPAIHCDAAHDTTRRADLERWHNAAALNHHQPKENSMGRLAQIRAGFWHFHCHFISKNGRPHFKLEMGWGATLIAVALIALAIWQAQIE